MKALVLGCGPAGLMVAHAFSMHGNDVIVVSKKRKSEMYGAQYLHYPIPGMTEKAGHMVSYELKGTPKEYREKVYGPTSKVKVSPTDYVGEHMAYDIRSTYDNLWDTYGDYVQNVELSPDVLRAAIKDLKPDAVLSTIPMPWLCEDETHSFIKQQVWAIGDAPERGVFCPVTVPAFSVVCNGEPVPGWYRAANVFNRKTAEWPERSKPPIRDVALIDKPIRTTCDCFPDVIRLGRFGKWAKGELTHHAWQAAITLCERNGVQGSLL